MPWWGWTALVVGGIAFAVTLLSMGSDKDRVENEVWLSEFDERRAPNWRRI